MLNSYKEIAKEIIKNNDLYEEMHEKVANEIVETIYAGFKESGKIEEEDLIDIIEEIAFNIGSIIDGSAAMEVNGREVLPYLAFSESREKREHLFISDTGSYIHEMIAGTVEDVVYPGDEE